MQFEVAERLVEFEWPDKFELTAAKLKKIQASVPIAERVWALKNLTGLEHWVDQMDQKAERELDNYWNSLSASNGE